MKPVYRKQVWDLMAEKAAHVDAFIAVSHYYGAVMKEKMRIRKKNCTWCTSGKTRIVPEV